MSAAPLNQSSQMQRKFPLSLRLTLYCICILMSKLNAKEPIQPPLPAGKRMAKMSYLVHSKTKKGKNAKNECVTNF